ncbi:MAG: site-specific integrase [Evtepia gabavorous]
MYHWMTQAEIQRFLAHLRREERSPGTLAKYRRDLLAFAARLPQGGRVDKEQVLAWKEEMARRYAPSTVNSMIAASTAFCLSGLARVPGEGPAPAAGNFSGEGLELDKGSTWPCWPPPDGGAASGCIT